MFSILHISDLHRAPTDPISNDELVSSLTTDLDRYVKESPVVPRPEAIVVSGDIIQGVPLGQNDYRAELRSQYAVAHAFLDELTRRVLGGDRSRVIIVPGNHDVDWNTAFAAMTAVDEASIPQNLAEALTQRDSAYRWTWKTRQLYRITNAALYASRFDAFWDFFEDFYRGVPGLLRVARGADVNLFELHDRRIGVAAFNSCYGNDCFALHGAIPAAAIARSQLDMADHYAYDLKIAVWHHSIEGPPYRTDYMDIELVRSMIGRGFRLGLHGHHHRTEVRPHYVDLPDRETMPVISAGSLCAGAIDLPPGVNRQYNVLEVSDDCHHARIHVREMTVGALFSPSRLTSFGGESFIDVEWTPPADPMGRPVDIERENRRALIDDAERELRGGSAARARDLLLPIKDKLEAYGRRILLEAASESADWNALLAATNPPTSIEELTFYVRATGMVKDFKKGHEALASYAPRLGLPEPNRSELERWLDAQEALAR